MGEESRDITAPKTILIIAMLFMLAEAVAYFWLADAAFADDAILILYGILNLVFLAVIFISLDLVSLGPVKIPYFWWINLIIGVLLILFSYLVAEVYGYALEFAALGIVWGSSIAPYFAGALVLLAVFIELITTKKDIKASKLITLLGIALTIWDCVAIFLHAPTDIAFVHAVFGIILAIILLILVLDLVDIKIQFTWWVFLTIAFVIFTWVSPTARLMNILVDDLPVVGWAGTFLMIAWVLTRFDM